MFMLHSIFNKKHLQNIVEDLVEQDLPGITILQAFSKGEINVIEKGYANKDVFEKVKVEIVLPNKKKLELAKEIIRSECQDLGYGAGKLWVTAVLEVERIRTGEKDVAALTINKKNGSENFKLDLVFSNTDTPAS